MFVVSSHVRSSRRGDVAALDEVYHKCLKWALRTRTCAVAYPIDADGQSIHVKVAGSMQDLGTAQPSCPTASNYPAPSSNTDQTDQTQPQPRPQHQRLAAVTAGSQRPASAVAAVPPSDAAELTHRPPIAERASNVEVEATAALPTSADAQLPVEAAPVAQPAAAEPAIRAVAADLQGNGAGAASSAVPRVADVALTLYREAAEAMEKKLQAVPKDQGRRSQRELEMLIPALSPTAQDASAAHATVMSVLRIWDGTVKGTRQHEWAAEIRSLVNDKLKEAEAQPLHVTRRPYYESQQAASSATDHSELLKRALKDAAKIMDGTCKRTGAQYLLVIVDERTGEWHSNCTAEIAGLQHALNLGQAAQAWAQVNRSRRVAAALAAGHETQFSDLEPSEQIAAARELFRHLVGDHRQKYPFQKGEARLS